MRKTFVFLSLIIFTFLSCEKDDFCTQNPVTPKLILRFYDDTNRESVKTVDNLYVWAEGKDSLFINASLDSLFIPLNSAATETVYNFSKNNVVNQFTIQYTTENDFVSRSCGFKVIFNDVNFTSDNTWITDFEPSNLTTIENQNEAHVQIYH
ncbi:DUF6452 family protein [Polaribacter sp. MED152]|uniref:DUF6452 family protein n=1 Tax=Polaribacter sp. MED152 TaxID=313598 RepID=UPI000068CC9A|nr:DUF6452 family protein [Polaribacter sp. MED152]EAQ41217.1 hypothetical protein MED152_00845 [Polaribacter sp. MED152]